MNILAVIHGSSVRAGVFEETVVEAGHQLEEWSLAWRTPPPRPIDDYGAVMVFGGSMHADEESRHAWLREEDLFIQRLIDRHVPILGVCLGAQLVAKAAGSPVRRASEPEIGWVTVELTAAAAADPVLGSLPERFDAFEWHHYTYSVPAGAEELARSAVCTQAFRLGETTWAIQFHAEVTQETIDLWLADREHPAPDPAGIAAATPERIAEWNRIGRAISGAFVEVAERATVPA